MMDTMVLLGILGSFFFGIQAYFTYKILQNFQDHFQIAVRMFFLDERSLKAYKIIASAVSLLAVSLLLQAWADRAGMEYWSSFGHFIAVLSIASFVFFYIEIYRATKAPSEKEKYGLEGNTV